MNVVKSVLLIISSTLTVYFAGCGPIGGSSESSGETAPGVAAASEINARERGERRRERDARIGETTPSTPSTPIATVKYPVVLLHGFMGGKRMGHFVGVTEHLKKQGVRAFEAEVAGIGSIAHRAGQLAPQIDDVLAETRADKVHLIAHSMGGLDARYLISTMKYGDRVASLTTLGTPHLGTPVADMALKTNNGQSSRLMEMFASMMMRTANGQPSGDLNEAIQNLSVEYVTGTFNPANPDDSRVVYRSLGGKTGERDRTKVMLSISSLILRTQGAHDGVVPLASTKWGSNHTEVEADHLDLLGMSMLDGQSPFKVIPFVDSTLAELAAKGL